MSGASFEDVVKLILDISQFQQAEAQAAAAWRQGMADIVKAGQSMNNDVIQMLKNIEYEVERAGQGSLVFGKRVEQTGLTVARSLRIMASGFAGMGDFQLASLTYGMERVSQVAGVASTNIMSIGPAASTAAVAVAALAAPFVAMFSGMEFNKKLAEMSTLLDNDAGETRVFAADLENLKNVIVDVAVRWNQDLIPTTEAFKEALSSGIRTDELDNFMNAAGQLATATSTGLREVVDMLTAYKDAYHLSISQMGALNDVLFSTIDVSKVQMEAYAQSIGRVIPVAQSAGVSITDLNGAFAALNRQGETGSQAVTSLAEFIRKIVDPSKEARAEFERLGIAFGQAAFSGRSFTEVMADLYAKTGGDADILAKLFPESRAQRAAVLLASTGDKVKFLGDITEQVASRIGIAMSAADKAQDSASAQMGKAWKALTDEFKAGGDEIIKMVAKAFFGDGGLSEKTLNNIRSLVDRITLVLEGLAYAAVLVANNIRMAFTPIVTVISVMVHNLEAAYYASTLDFGKAWDKIKDSGHDLVNAFNNVKDAIGSDIDGFEAMRTAMQNTSQHISDLAAKNNYLGDVTGKTAITTGDLAKQLQGEATTAAKAKEETDVLAAAYDVLDAQIKKLQATFAQYGQLRDAEFAKEMKESATRLDQLAAEEKAKLDAMAKDAEVTHDRLKTEELLHDEIKRFRTEEVELLKQETEEHARDMLQMKQQEQDRVQALREAANQEIEALKQTTEFQQLAKEQQKSIIDEIEQKRNEAIEKETQGYEVAVQAANQAEADKQRAIQATIDKQLDSIHVIYQVAQAAQDAANSIAPPATSQPGASSGSERRNRVTDLGVDRGAATDAFGDLLVSADGTVHMVGGSGDGGWSHISPFGLTQSPFSSPTIGGPTQQSSQFSTVINVSPQSATPNSGMSPSDIDTIVDQVRQQLERQAATQTGGSSYPTGYTTRP